jgi:hypothetical protein
MEEEERGERQRDWDREREMMREREMRREELEREMAEREEDRRHRRTFMTTRPIVVQRSSYPPSGPRDNYTHRSRGGYDLRQVEIQREPPTAADSAYEVRY